MSMDISLKFLASWLLSTLARLCSHCKPIFLIAAWCFCFGTAFGADLRRVEKAGGGIYRIHLTGSIELGDSERFRQLVNQDLDSVYISVHLDSPGGDIQEALRVSEMIRELGLSTTVLPDGICASACFFIWLSGEPKTASSLAKSRYFGRVGLHRPYFSNPGNDMKSQRAQEHLQRTVREFLNLRSVPGRLIDMMMSRASNEIYWLHQRDLDELGEYSHGTEELLIARCRYDKNLVDKVALFDESKRTTEADRLRAQLKLQDDCVDDQRYERIKNGRLQFVSKYGVKQSSLISPISQETQEDYIVSRVHPGWQQIVQSDAFRKWFNEQEKNIRDLAKSDKAIDAIRLIDLYKRSTAR